MIVARNTLLFISLLTSPVFAGSYEEGMRLYKAGSYADSIQYFEKASEAGDKRAQYRLAYIYENALEVPKDTNKALYLYKLAASEYKSAMPPNTNQTSDAKNNTYLYYLDPLTDNSMNRQIFNRLDMPKNFEERETLMSRVFSNFGLFPYQKNFIIPFAYTSENYENRNPNKYPFYDRYTQNSEAEFQISLKKALSYNLLGFNESVSFGYTQEAWWQIYAESAPFREASYRPELWITFPMKEYTASKYGLKAVKFGFLHESNGQADPFSRSWNKIYSDLLFQHGNLITELRAWYANPEEANKDIGLYLGYGHLKLGYLAGKHQFALTWRNNLRLNGDNVGSIEGEWSYPIGNSQNSFWYIKAFSGYGASLGDYSQQQNRIGFGFLFSR